MVKMSKVNFSPHTATALIAIVAIHQGIENSAPQPGHISGSG